MNKRQPFNERTRTMILQVPQGENWVSFPGESDLFIEFTWNNSQVVKAEIVNGEFDFIGDFLGRVEVQ